ncbi:hypothetical protein BG004_002570, partial [Podila humilis]
HSANECATFVKESHTFFLESISAKALLSSRADQNLLFSGGYGDKNFKPLRFCVVTNDVSICNEPGPSSCIKKGVEYRIRVEGGLKGYVKEYQGNFMTTSDFHDAVPLVIEGNGESNIQVLFAIDLPPFAWTIPESRAPVTLEMFSLGARNQVFRVLPIYRDMQHEKFSGDNQCIPEVNVREYESFQLRSTALRTLVSQLSEIMALFGGDDGDKSVQPLEFCIVSTDGPCNPPFPANCIYQNVEYRIKVNGPVQGYLRVANGIVYIVPDFEEASGLNLYREEAWGLRIAHIDCSGKRFVFETLGKRRPIEYQVFQLQSKYLRSYLSREIGEDVLVSGDEYDDFYERLDFCFVTDENPCSPSSINATTTTITTTDCVQKRKEYRIKITRPIQGYLHVTNDGVDIVPTFERATGFRPFVDVALSGLRIGYFKKGYIRADITGIEQGAPVKLARPEQKSPYQVFKVERR